MGSDSTNNSIVQFLENKTILITGGSGFLAKILLEKILRIQPNVATIYLLIRASDSNSLMHRFQNEVLGKEVFRVLRAKYGENFDSFMFGKVVPVAGDLSSDDMGIKDRNTIEKMCNKLDIIVGLAATTNFDERYDVAMGTNTWGALHILNFANKCTKVKMLLYVSTVYVCGEKEGIILESPLSIDGETKLDIDAENRLIEDKLRELRSKKASEEAIKSTMRQLGMIRAKEHGWPNTYVFTKAMGEMLLEKFKNEVPLIILRPSMVASTFQQPFPGWIEGARTFDGVIAGYSKGKIKFLPVNPESIFDPIPADMVINSILVAVTVYVINQSSRGVIYHIGSSSRNPIKNATMLNHVFQYFTNNPLMDARKQAIKVKRLKLLNSMAKFRREVMIRYLLPLKVLRLVNIVSCLQYKELYDTSMRRIKSMMRLANLYEHYFFYKSIFDDRNSEKLRLKAREMGLMEEDGFNFDPSTIDWEDYLVNTHIPGLVRHVLLKRPN